MRTSSRHNAALAMLALVACTRALALDATELDTDRDGIGDGIDNCPTVYNPDQADTEFPGGPGDACSGCPATRATGRDLDGDGIDDGCDLCIGPGPTGEDADGDGIDDGCDPCVNGVSAFDVDDDHDGIQDGCDTCVGYIGVDIDRDGIDDSCDACLAGPPDDQDLDGIEDGCDFCPVIPSPGNANTGDADEIGDACETGVGASNEARVLFDGFRIDDPDRWNAPRGGTWHVGSDLLHVTSVATGTAPVLRTSVAQVAVTFSIMARVDPEAGSALGIALSSDGTQADAWCSIDNHGTLAFVVNGKTALPIQNPATAGPYVLGLVGASVGPSQALRCQLRSATDLRNVVDEIVLPGGSGSGIVGVAAVGSGKFDWIEAIQATNVTN